MRIAILLSILLGYSAAGMAQTRFTAYLELHGTVINGTPYINSFSKPKKLDNKADSLTNFTEIEIITNGGVTSRKVINSLSLKGWSLVSVSSYQYSFEQSPSLLYYFKREYIVEDISIK